MSEAESTAPGPFHPLYARAFDLAYPILVAGSCDTPRQDRLTAAIIAALSVSPVDLDSVATIRRAVEDAHRLCEERSR